MKGSLPPNSRTTGVKLAEAALTHSISAAAHPHAHNKPHPGHLYTSGIFSAPSIPSSGMRNYDDGLQIGFGVESAASVLSSVRPQTADLSNHTHNLSHVSTSSSSQLQLIQSQDTTRAKSASSIMRSRKPGHTFSRHVRDTTGSLINNVDAIMRASSPSITRDTSPAAVPADGIQFLSSRPSSQQLPDRPNTGPPGLLLPPSSASSKNRRDGGSYAPNQSLESTLFTAFDDDTVTPRSHEERLIPRHGMSSPPMCYSRKSLKELFVLEKQQAQKVPKLIDANYPVNNLDGAFDHYLNSAKESKQRFGKILAHGAIKSPKAAASAAATAGIGPLVVQQSSSKLFAARNNGKSFQ